MTKKSTLDRRAILLSTLVHLTSASIVRETLDTNTTCSDVANWTDINGDTCAWYSEEGLNRCELFGSDFETNDGGHTASSACCVCGGGDAVMSITCIDDVHYQDPNGFTCADYALDSDSEYTMMDDVLYETGKTRCELFSELFQDISDLGEDDVATATATPQEKCCACGGGYASDLLVPSFAPVADGINDDDDDMNVNVNNGSYYENEECRNVADWIDATERFDCPYFEVDPEHRCATYGHYNLNMGHVANSACCACNGGINPAIMYYPEASADTLCIDRPNWSAAVGDIQLTCDSFYDDNLLYSDTATATATAEDEDADYMSYYYSCEQFGNVLSSTSTSSSSARQACCRCNGGFNGTLIGKTLRISFPQDADSLYALFTNSTTNLKDGSTVQFMMDVAKSAGFGMYETEVSDVAKAEHPHDSFQACRLDVELGNTDLCIGPMWDISFHDVASDSLYTDSFFLVVPKHSDSFTELFMAPIMPFSYGAWLWVVVTCLYMSVAIHIMRSHKDPHAQEVSLPAKICSVIYSSIKSCVGGDVHNSKNYNPNTPEKIVVTGFVIFALIILTAYSATTAAFLVSARGGSGAYTSLDDILKADNATICVHESTVNMFREQFLAASSVLDGKPYDSGEFLDALGTDECDAVVLIADYLSYLRAMEGVNVCSNVHILYQQSLLDVDIHIPAYPLLADMGEELVDQMNLLIEEGVYAKWHNEYVNRVVVAEAAAMSDGDDINSVTLNSDQQSYIAAAGTMSTSSGSYLASLCGGSVELNLEKFELGARNLFMPIVLSLACSTIGLIVYMMSRAKDSTVWKKKAVAARVLELNEREEEKLLRQELEETAPFELFMELKEMIDQALREENDDPNSNEHGHEHEHEHEQVTSNATLQIKLNEAVDALPDKNKLVDLAFRMKCSDDIQEYLLIGEELDLAELCLLAEFCRSRCGILDDDTSTSLMEDTHAVHAKDHSIPTSTTSATVMSSIANTNMTEASPNNGYLSAATSAATATADNEQENDMSVRRSRLLSLRSAVMMVNIKRSLILPPSIKECLNDNKDPKGALVHGLFRCAATRRVAVHCAKRKKEARLASAGGVLEFDISEHMDFENHSSLDGVEKRDNNLNNSQTFAEPHNDTDETVRWSNTDSTKIARTRNSSQASQQYQRRRDLRISMQLYRD